MSYFDAFVAPFRARAVDSWFSAGLTTSFPDIVASGSTVLSDALPCKESLAPGCKIFHVPGTDSSQAVEVNLQDTGTIASAGLQEQVMVFQYQGEFHAVDHSCPHSSFPLSQGTPFDIEDFGVRLSVGLKCPKHDWSFDLYQGNGDRGNYRLKIWEVQLRPAPGAKIDGSLKEGGEEREVWVRRKQRIG